VQLIFQVFRNKAGYQRTARGSKDGPRVRKKAALSRAGFDRKKQRALLIIGRGLAELAKARFALSASIFGRRAAGRQIP
jgi:hypothetical protein